MNPIPREPQSAVRGKDAHVSRPQEVLVTCSRTEDRFALARMLVRCGLKPVLSSSVEKARSLLARRPVRLVFCDDELPDGSVGRLLEEIRKAASRIPVVVISRLENWDEYLRAMRLGAFDYISSPIRRAEVERVVTRALEEATVPSLAPHFDPDGGSGLAAMTADPKERGSDAEGQETQPEREKPGPGSKRVTRRLASAARPKRAAGRRRGPAGYPLSS
jgi:DNA-binding response OmpR family regulator